MSDRIVSIAALFALAFLAFLAGSYVVLAQVFPHQLLRNAYVAGKALMEQRGQFDVHYASDLWYTARTPQRGVTVLEETRAQPGYTLYTSGHDQVALLITLDGRVVHQWRMPYSQVWDKSSPIEKPVPDYRTYFRKAHLYPNGDLLVVYDGVGDTPHGYGVVKLDRDSKVLWKYLDRAHHDLDVAPDGRVFALTHEVRVDHFEPRAHLTPPRIEDYLVELSAEGQQRRKIRLLQAVADSDYARYFDILPWYLVGKGDYMHTNAVDYVDADAAQRFPFLREGQVLLSMRELGALMAIDPQSSAIGWGLRGSWVGQHDPDFLENGRLLLFDNSGHYGEGGRSRVIEIDPMTGGIVWQYAGDEAHPLSSVTRAEQQRLPNGNTLITEAEGGRLVEVTRSGDIVWEYINPVRSGDKEHLLPVVSWGQRIDPQSLDPGFRQSLQAAERREPK